MPALANAVADMGYTQPDADPGQGDSGRPGRSRPDRLRLDRHRQDRRLPAAHPAAAARPSAAGCRALILSPTRELAHADRRAGPGARLPRRPQRRRGGRRGRHGPAGARAARRQRHRGRHAGPPARPHALQVRRPERASRWWCSTRPTACSTWASCPTCSASWRRCRRPGRRCCSPRRCRRASSSWPATILRDPVTVTVDRQQPAGGIAHSAYRVARTARRRCSRAC